MAPKTKVGLFAAIRRDSRVEGLSARALARKFGVRRRMVREALKSAWSAPRIGRSSLIEQQRLRSRRPTRGVR